MTTKLRLEEFSDQSDDRPEIGPSADYLAGFEDGVRAGQHAAEKQHDHLSKALVTHVQNIELTRTDLRQDLMTAIAPVIGQVIETVLPTLASESFVPHLAQEIQAALDAATDTSLILAVNPGQRASVRHVLDRSAIQVAADPDLEPDQARLSVDKTETLIDLPALVGQLQEALAGLLPDERTTSHV